MISLCGLRIMLAAAAPVSVTGDDRSIAVEIGYISSVYGWSAVGYWHHEIPASDTQHCPATGTVVAELHSRTLESSRWYYAFDVS